MKLHNRFDFFINGEKVAQAENIVLDRAYDDLGYHSFAIERLGNYLQLGTGTAQPKVTDTALTAKTQAIDMTTNRKVVEDPDNNLRTVTSFRELNTSECNGSYTEVGLSSTTDNLVATKALITDASGSPITLVKTSTDKMTVSYTLYLDYTQMLICSPTEKVWTGPYIENTPYVSKGQGTVAILDAFVPSPAWVMGGYFNHGVNVPGVNKGSNTKRGTAIDLNNTVIGYNKRVYSLAMAGDPRQGMVCPIQKVLPNGLPINGAILGTGDATQVAFPLAHPNATISAVRLNNVVVNAKDYTIEQLKDYGTKFGQYGICEVLSDYRVAAREVHIFGEGTDVAVLSINWSTGSSINYKYGGVRITGVSYDAELDKETTFNAYTRIFERVYGIESAVAQCSADTRLLYVFTGGYNDLRTGLYTYLRTGSKLTAIDLAKLTSVTSLKQIHCHATAKEVLLGGVYNGVSGTHKFSYTIDELHNVSYTFIETMSQEVMITHNGSTGRYSTGTLFFTGTKVYKLEVSEFIELGTLGTWLSEGMTQGLNEAKKPVINKVSTEGTVTKTYTLPLDGITNDFWKLTTSPLWMAADGTIRGACGEADRGGYEFRNHRLITWQYNARLDAYEITKIEGPIYAGLGERENMNWFQFVGAARLTNYRSHQIMCGFANLMGSALTTVPIYVQPGKTTVVFKTPPAAGQEVSVDYTLPYFPKDDNWNLKMSMEIEMGRGDA